jgi:3-(3-hydroxy-phenyl)propionate hydroxylase
VEYVQAQTIANKKLLEEKDLNVRRKNLMQLRSTADDLEKTKAFMRRTSLLESVRSSEAVT